VERNVSSPHAGNAAAAGAAVVAEAILTAAEPDGDAAEIPIDHHGGAVAGFEAPEPAEGFRRMGRWRCDAGRQCMLCRRIMSRSHSGRCCKPGGGGLQEQFTMRCGNSQISVSTKDLPSKMLKSENTTSRRIRARSPMALLTTPTGA